MNAACARDANPELSAKTRRDEGTQRRTEISASFAVLGVVALNRWAWAMRQSDSRNGDN